MSKKLKQAITLVVFIMICGLAAWGSRNLAQPSGAERLITWLSIVPPLLAVTLALMTEKLILSLVAAVVVGGLMAGLLEQASVGGVVEGAKISTLFVWGAVSDPVNLQILAFVVLVIALITLVIVAGGVQAIVGWLMKFAKGPRSTQIVTTLMGIAIFIDDYTNTMIVGSTMRPLSDRNRVSREKLAFLVDATSAPVSGIAVISTWIGYEVGLFDKAAKSLGIPLDGYSLFFDALSFRFYCILTIIFVLLNVLLGKDFGPMAKAERRARETGKLAADDARPLTSRTYTTVEAAPRALPRASTAVIPMVVLFSVLLVGLWRDGGGFALDGASFLSFSSWREVISASENNILILAYAAGAGLGVALLTSTLISKLPASMAFKSIGKGAQASLLPIVILVLAWALKASCDRLQTGMFLSATVGGVLSPVWFPAVLFVVAGLTAFATGTSWGTMAILIPTATPLAFSLDGGVYGLTTMMSLAAILDGAIFGDHCSPISDTTIMSSISSSCDHVHHVRTQMPYAVTCATLALGCGYLPAAMGVRPGIGILIATFCIVALLFAVGRRAGSKTPSLTVAELQQ